MISIFFLANWCKILTSKIRRNKYFVANSHQILVTPQKKKICDWFLVLGQVFKNQLLGLVYRPTTGINTGTKDPTSLV